MGGGEGVSAFAFKTPRFAENKCSVTQRNSDRVRDTLGNRGERVWSRESASCIPTENTSLSLAAT